MTDAPKIIQHPKADSSARTVLAQAMEEATDGSVAFVILIEGDDVRILASAFKTRDICWASKILEGHALEQAMK